MITPNYQEVKKLAKDYSFIPISKEIYADTLTPISVIKNISQASKKHFLLESIEGGEKRGRYSFMSYEPSLHIICKNKQLKVNNKIIEDLEGRTAYEYLRNIMDKYSHLSLQDYHIYRRISRIFSYEMISYFELAWSLKNSQSNEFDLMLLIR